MMFCGNQSKGVSDISKGASILLELLRSKQKATQVTCPTVEDVTFIHQLQLPDVELCVPRC